MAELHDGKKVLSRLSGLPEEEIGSIFEEVKVNHARLDSCSRHEFSKHVPLQRRYVCTRCGGRVSATERLWYHKGMVDAVRGTCSGCAAFVGIPRTMFVCQRADKLVKGDGTAEACEAVVRLTDV